MMPRPRWMILGYEPKGHDEQVALPPDPHTDNQLCVGLRDWLARPNLWNERRLTSIPGAGGDSVTMMRTSFRENIGCSPLQGDCHGCKKYQPTKCKLPIDNPHAVCPHDTPTFRHTMETCLKCQNYNELGYVCQKWMSEGPDWRDLWGAEAGKTCLLCAPGPHFAEHKEEIEKLAQDREHYFTLGISRAINTIVPNYYFSIERRKPAYWNCDERHYPQTKLIACSTADWRMCRAFRNRWYGEAFNGTSEMGAFMDSAKERCTIVMGNASADALMIAYRLGAKEIWVYGYEFSCAIKRSENPDEEDTITNYYHDMDITDPHLRLWGVSQLKYFPAMGIGGDMCATSYHLITVAAYCEAVAEMVEKNGVKVVNKTQKGQWWFGQKSPEEKALEAEVQSLKAQLEAKK